MVAMIIMNPSDEHTHTMGKAVIWWKGSQILESLGDDMNLKLILATPQAGSSTQQAFDQICEELTTPVGELTCSLALHTWTLAHLNTCSLAHFFDHLLTCIAQCTRAPLSLHQQDPASKITGWHNSSRLSQRERDRGRQGGRVGGWGGGPQPPTEPLSWTLGDTNLVSGYHCAVRVTGASLQGNYTLLSPDS